MIKKALVKLAILCLIFSIPTIGFTSSNFVDAEVSLGNNLSASSLDLSLRNTSDVLLSSPFFNETGFLPGSNNTKTLRVKKDGTEDFKYQLSVNKTGGDDGLCNALLIEAKLDGVVQYSGSLLGLNLSSVPTVSGGQDDWTFIVSLADNNASLQSKTCNFDLKVKGWQTDSDGIWGFLDQESLGNNISTGTWIASGDVVINELMWMGSAGNENDEWIELRNTTNNQIDLSGWQITKWVAGTHEELMLTIESGKTIPANGFFLITRLDKTASAINVDPDVVDTGVLLANSTLRIKLYKSDWTNSVNLIDTADDGAGTPMAGSNGSPDKKSMERNDDPTTGWHPCTDLACNDTTYWDSEGNNYGTPKAANLSENDPSSPDFKPDTKEEENSSSVSLDLKSEETTPSAETKVDNLESSEGTPSAEPEQTPAPTPIPSSTITPEPSITPEPTVVPTETPAPTSVPVEEPKPETP